MMFITPTPPTSRAIPAIRIITAATPPVIWRKLLSMPTLVKIAKSFG
jgi:hypothetical protein